MSKKDSYWASRADDLVMIPLALVSVGLLAWEFTTTLSPAQKSLLDTIDLIIALIFLSEFCIKWFLARDKKFYFRHNWWYLLASIPITTPTTQALRALRLLRLIRLFRVTTGVTEFFESTGVIYIGTLFGVLLMAGSAAFELFEFGVNPNLHAYGDALWWALTTITTVGYGDIYPVTTAGRLVATVLIIGGVGIQGSFVALLASFLLKNRRAT